MTERPDKYEPEPKDYREGTLLRSSHSFGIVTRVWYDGRFYVEHDARGCALNRVFVSRTRIFWSQAGKNEQNSSHIFQCIFRGQYVVEIF